MTFATARFGILALILASSIALGQTAETIKHMIASQAPPTAPEAPALHKMGDAAARQITELLKGRAPLSVTEQRNVVDIVRTAFEQPNAIARQADRSPTASMALLKRIGADLRDPGLQGRLAETQQLVAAASVAK